MSNAERMQTLLFDYETIGPEAFVAGVRAIPPKLRRWLATHHPDNRCRRVCLEESGVTIGAGTVINAGIVVSDGYLPLVRIGARVAIAPDVVLVAQSGPNNSRLGAAAAAARLVREAPIVIGDDAWIGAGAIILPGVRLGTACVIGAGAVIAKDVPDHAIVRGEASRVRGRLDVAAEVSA